MNFLMEGRIEAGCDEAGRGPLAGPVFAAAVILPPDFHHPLLNDSKKMTEKARETLRPIIERPHPTVLIETDGQTRDQIIEIFSAMGYKAYMLMDGREVELDTNSDKDIIFRYL